VKQDPLAVPGTLLRTRFLHRVHRASPGPGADYRAAAHPDRRGDRGCGPLGVGGRHRPRGVVADRAPRVRRPRQGVSGRARTDPGARHRRDPPRKAPLDALRADAAVGEGRSVGHRVRRPGRLPGLARATWRAHRGPRHRLATWAHVAVPRSGSWPSTPPRCTPRRSARQACYPTRRSWSITSTSSPGNCATTGYDSTAPANSGQQPRLQACPVKIEDDIW